MTAVEDGIVGSLQKAQMAVCSCQEGAAPAVEGSAAQRMVEAAPPAGGIARQAAVDPAEVRTLCYTRLPLC